MKLVKKVEKIVNKNPVKNETYEHYVAIEKKPYDFWNVKTISENTNKPQNKNLNNYGNDHGYIKSNIQYSIWY